MKKVNLIHLGIGNVGKALVRQIKGQSESLKKEFKVDLNYCGLFTSDRGIFDPKGLSHEQFVHFPQMFNTTDSQKAIEEVNLPFVVIDTTASDKTFPLLLFALRRGGFVVMSNKKPLASAQREFDLLHQAGEGKRLFYETTVGAGLPVISTLKNLLLTGDEIIEIKGCFSGTLGFLFSQLEEGMTFSQALRQAKEKGFTEPDPRDDLSGLDVARKALILARIIGRKLELSDIKLKSLYPKRMNKLSIDEFLQAARQLDRYYQERLQKANKKKKTLRFVATMTPKKCLVDLEEVDKSSDLGGLKGPDNLILFHTKRYFDNPLVIKGPGAGVDVTAAGVFVDILTIAGAY